MANKSGTSSQVISLPKGGGAISGIGETFSPDLFTGTGNFTIPIPTSPSRASFGPKLSLQYSTGNGNSPFGLGWKLSIPRITRKTEKGLPRYTDEDVFVLSGAEDLVLADSQVPDNGQPAGYSITRYRPRTEGLFARIEKWTQTSGVEAGDVHWRIVTKDNVTNIYGKSKSARIVDPDHADHVFEWLLEETYDNKGNHILYEYVQENPDVQIQVIYEQNKRYTQTYLRRIFYGNTPDTLDTSLAVGHKRVATDHLHSTQSLERHYVFEVLFDYGDIPDILEIPHIHATLTDNLIPTGWPVREDPFSSFRSGFEIRTLRRCRRVLMLHHFQELDGAPLVRSLDLEYEVNPETKLSLLTGVQAKGYRKKDDAYFSSAMPSVSFGYSAFKPHEQRYQSVTAKGNDLPSRPLNHQEFSLVDLFGDALPDIVEANNGDYYYWRNLGNANIDRRHPQHEPIPSVSAAQPNVAFADMGGDGAADLLVDAPPLAGFFESTPNGRWKPFRRFESFPSVDLSDPSVRLLDLTGDGLSDMLMTRDQHFLWFQCLGEEGYGESQHVARVHDLNEFPDVYFDDPSGRVRLADMTGDGLNDIVLVHNGRIDYWPNLGYGRFGKRVTMEQSPRLPANVNPRQVFLVDLDRTGCADLVYVDHCQVHFWFNQSGNGWSDQQTIQGTPYVSDLTAIQFADFFGTGTASLIWSYDYAQESRGNYKVLDFSGGKKPYLLTEMGNNLGATTRVQYAASTKFYLEDKEAGTPWATNLPFPVQVVEKTEVIDHIGKTKLVTTYKPHHGCYNGREREFRGFGRMDRCDTEEFELFSGMSLHGDESEINNKQRAYHVPPVLTKTWFHTGVYFDEDNVSPSGAFYDHNDLMEAYEKEFYRVDSQAFHLTNHEVEHTDNPHEAYRALRGAAIRTEVFALDGSNRAEHPYTVVENRYSVKELQAKDGNNHGVYLTTQKESVSYHYERNPDDPRIGQNLVLAVDEYGQVTDSLSVAYPRRQASPDLPEQAEINATYTKTDYINKPNEAEYYYLGIPCQTRTYEVTGMDWTSGNVPLKPEAFVSIIAPPFVQGEFQPYEWQRPEGHVGLEKRLIEWQRSYFRTDASAELLDITRNAEGYPTRTLSNRLALGEIESLALPYESFTAALSDNLLAQVFSGPVNVSALMLIEGGYHQEPDSAGYWWVPSGQQAFSPELFYLPAFNRGPFGFDAQITYDKYALAPVETVDALQNQVQAKIDYRVLQPEQITDPNGNRTAVVFDALGLVAGSAVMGKEGENLGDELTSNFKTDLTQSEIDQFVADPRAKAAELLDTATTRIIYDLHRYENTGQPPFAATLARETHTSDPVPADGLKIQVSFSYSDGFGRIVQSKVQAEPDKATPNLPRWVGTGTTVYNNKGKAVKQYEPFFSDTHHYGIEQHGISPILFYDPLERVVATLHPNHTYEKVLFDPWRQESWGVNDTVALDPRTDPHVSVIVGPYFQEQPNDWKTWLQQRGVDPQNPPQDTPQLAPEKKAAVRTLNHAATPIVVHFDTLGRLFLTVAHNRVNSVDEFYRTRLELDVEGNQRTVIDARDRVVMRYDYDILANRIHQTSMEAGERWMLNDVAGNPIRAWDSRGHEFRTEYDELRRPLRRFVRGTEASHSDPRTLGNEILFQKIEYGEGQANDTALNLRTRVFKQFDGAGIVTNDSYDFKGNLLHSTRGLAQDYKAIIDWAAAQQSGETFSGSTTYDALNRPVTMTAPDGSVTRPRFNEANLLNSVGVRLHGANNPEAQFVTNIDYDAKGQRERVEYGNNVATEYAYDPETYRLIHLKTTRSGFPANEQIVQDLHYAYDPTGNITSIRDNAQQTVYFNNAVVEPHTQYWYDAIYRLIEAHGREHLGQTGGQLQPPVPTSNTDAPRVGLPHPGDGNATGNYKETYAYDEVGNILEVDHKVTTIPGPAPDHWVRKYDYHEDSLIQGPAKKSNRLSSTTVGSETVHYEHDEHGNMTKMPHLVQMKWNFEDQLHEVDLGGGGRAYYVYDAGGERVRKIVEKNSGSLIEERIYLGGFEPFRVRQNDNVTLERNTLHIMDDTQRVAMVESKTIDTDNDPSPVKLTRYQFGNHLGSASLELDEHAQIISYEEYAPYGSTSYQAVRSQTETPKRYRYTGKERDEESGLYYYGARYYASWLARWTAADPAGLVDGINLYSYVKNGPINLHDPNGNTSQQFSTREDPLSYPNWEQFADENADRFSSYEEARVAWHKAHGLDPYQSSSQPPPTDTSDPSEGAQVKVRANWNRAWEQGRSATMSEPLTMDVDEPRAVGERGISRREAYKRATSAHNRQFLDPVTNRITKRNYPEGSRGGSMTHRPPRPPVSVVDNPSVIFTRRFSEVKELTEIFNEAKAKYAGRTDLTPGQIKEHINRRIRAHIRSGKSAAAVKVRQALAKLGWTPRLRPMVAPKPKPRARILGPLGWLFLAQSVHNVATSEDPAETAGWEILGLVTGLNPWTAAGTALLISATNPAVTDEQMREGTIGAGADSAPDPLDPNTPEEYR